MSMSKSMYADNPPYERSAGRVTVTGWCCHVCGTFHGDRAGAEHAARWCCASSSPCGTEGCAGRRTHRSGYTVCDGCRDKYRAGQWAALYAEKAVAWDGETPLCMWDGDRYFYSPEDIADHVNDDAGEGESYRKWHDRVSELRLVLCEPAKPCEFRMAEYLADDLPDEDHGGGDEDFADIDKVVNDFIEAGRDGKPWSWSPAGVPVSVESVLSILGVKSEK